MAPCGVSRAMGGRTPNASAVSMMMLRGWPPTPVGTALSMKEIG